jgi:hypothetical protein
MKLKDTLTMGSIHVTCKNMSRELSHNMLDEV